MSPSTWQAFNNNTALEAAVLTTSGSAALFSLVLTCYLVFRHLKHFVDAVAQRAIIRILLMVPFYATVSWLAILLGDYALYFKLVRDCYEAYVLYQFFSLIVYYTEKESPAHFKTRHYGIEKIMGPESIGQLMTYYKETRFPFPLCCLSYQPSNRVFQHIKRCSLQYVFVKPCLSAIAILLQILGLYHPGSFDYRYSYFWLVSIENISAALALFFIFMFYDLVKKVIEMHSPLMKLISIKILVFFVFWQGITVGLLYYFKVIPAFFSWSNERSSETVQNVLICMEMTGLSIFNLYAFPYIVYRTQPGEHTLDTALRNIQSVLSQKDVALDAVDAFHPDRLKHAIEKHTD